MNERKKILITNDDGYESPGIIAVAEALAALGDVMVVAPDRDRSGVSHSVSIAAPVAVSEVFGRAVPTYRCSGTPADCVVVGTYDLCGGTPSLLVSGINRGANLGDDINYSGTFAAALEGVIVGVPSIAVSLAASWPEAGREHHWETAAGVAKTVASDVLAHGLPRHTLLNVNVPNVARDALRGTSYVRQGAKRIAIASIAAKIRVAERITGYGARSIPRTSRTAPISPPFATASQASRPSASTEPTTKNSPAASQRSHARRRPRSTHTH